MKKTVRSLSLSNNTEKENDFGPLPEIKCSKRKMPERATSKLKYMYNINSLTETDKLQVGLNNISKRKNTMICTSPESYESDTYLEKETLENLNNENENFAQITPRKTRVKLSIEQFIERLRINGNLASTADKLEDRLYDIYAEDGSVNMRKFIMAISESGIKYKSDPRLSKLQYNIEIVEHYLMSHMGNDMEENLIIDRDLFKGIIIEEIDMLQKIFADGLAINYFSNFTSEIKKIYKNVSTFNDTGEVASYIPQLKRANPNWFGVSICTVDGQRWSIGDTKQSYTVQSTCKPINYALALSGDNSQHVHNYVGKEPSGTKFNSISLDRMNCPHNPMINSGAIMMMSLLQPDNDAADRFDWLHNKYKALCGKEYCGFNNSVYLSEKKEGHRNYALGHYMKESNSFPKGTDLSETLDFYFQSCSLEVNAESHAVIAATLANSGICPTTGERILKQEAVRKCLSLMLSCGMYDYSGQFAFEIGIPAKSGVSGCIILVIPGICGITLFSPKLDEYGNSVKGIEFCKHLINVFTFHHFDSMMLIDTDKIDPRKGSYDNQNDKLCVEVMHAAKRGDIHGMQRLAIAGANLQMSDYDDRTALHLAACENHIELLKFLLTFYPDRNADDMVVDRWGHTALDDAILFDNPVCQMYLEQWFDMRRHKIDRKSSKNSKKSLSNMTEFNKMKQDPSSKSCDYLPHTDEILQYSAKNSYSPSETSNENSKYHCNPIINELKHNNTDIKLANRQSDLFSSEFELRNSKINLPSVKLTSEVPKRDSRIPIRHSSKLIMKDSNNETFKSVKPEDDEVNDDFC